VWWGDEAAELGLAGTVAQDDLETLLRGHDPVSGTRLGAELLDRFKADGTPVRAVAGFDATLLGSKVAQRVVGTDGAGKTRMLPAPTKTFRNTPARCSGSPPPPKPPTCSNATPGSTPTQTPRRTLPTRPRARAVLATPRRHHGRHR
jgi:hypothetical protein